MKGDSEFVVRYTNRDIYKKLEDIEGHVLKTNGKVKLSMWVGTTALTLGIAIVGLLFRHIGG